MAVGIPTVLTGTHIVVVTMTEGGDGIALAARALASFRYDIRPNHLCGGFRVSYSLPARRDIKIDSFLALRQH